MDISSASFFTFSSPSSSDGDRIPGSYMDGFIRPCEQSDIPSWVFDKETEIVELDEINEKIRNYELVSGMKIGILRKYNDFSIVILGKYNFSRTPVDSNCDGFSNIHETRSYTIKDPSLTDLFVDILFDKKIILHKNLPLKQCSPKIVFCNRKKFCYKDEILAFFKEIQLPVVLARLICEYLPRKYSRKQLFRMLEQEFFPDGFSRSLSPIYPTATEHTELSIENETLDLSGAKFFVTISNSDIEKSLDRIVRTIVTFCTKHISIQTLILPLEVRIENIGMNKLFHINFFISHFHKCIKRSVHVSVTSKKNEKFYLWKRIFIPPSTGK